MMGLNLTFQGYIQKYVLSAIGSLSFQRNEKRDRVRLFEKLKAHVTSTKTAPIIIFPEGTCVNNEYTVLFHKGSFELGVAVCPVAIRYIEKYMHRRVYTNIDVLTQLI